MPADGCTGPPTGRPEVDPVSSRTMLAACGLPMRWRGADRFTVLELGWQHPAHFVATWQAWRADAGQAPRLRYLALLARPWPRHQLEACLHDLRHAGLGLDPVSARALSRGWPLPIEGVHRVELESGYLQLTLAVGDPGQLLPGLVQRVDALIVSADAGLPDPVVQRAARLLDDPSSRAVCRIHDADCIKALQAGGLQTLEAFSAKESSRGLAKDSGEALALYPRRRAPAAGPSGMSRLSCSRDALIVGGGLAGTAIAYALARRGWRIQVLDDGYTPAGSSQPVLAQHPSASVDDALFSRLTRSALALSQGPYASTALRHIGRLQCMDQATALRLAQAWPAELMQAVDAREAARLSGLPQVGPGLWWPQAGCAEPAPLLEAWHAEGMTRQRVARVDCLRFSATGWQACDAQGQVLAGAPVAIVAAGASSPALQVQVDTPSRLGDLLGPVGWQSRPGRATLARLDQAAMPACIVGGPDGHAVPVNASTLLIGPGAEPAPDVPDGADAQAIDPSARTAWTRYTRQTGVQGVPRSLAVTGSGLRLSCRDHLPLLGAVPDARAIDAAWAALRRNDRLPLPRLPGLWVACALGGRGLLWAVLGAEVLAAELDAEPLPLSRDLMQAIDPGRFHRRALREPGNPEAELTRSLRSP